MSTAGLRAACPWTPAPPLSCAVTQTSLSKQRSSASQHATASATEAVSTYPDMGILASSLLYTGCCTMWLQAVGGAIACHSAALHAVIDRSTGCLGSHAAADISQLAMCTLRIQERADIG